MASALKIFVDAATGQFEEAMRAATEDLKTVTMASAHESADSLKAAARADIASAGFSSRWQNTLQVEVYPSGGKKSTHPTIHVYHKIHYSQIFEEGGSIFGSPRLWIPLPDTPPRIGQQRITPQLYAQRIGPLFPIPGKTPGTVLLAARVMPGSGSSLASLRLAGRGAKGAVTKPMFFGIDQVTLRDRFSITEITEQAAARLPFIFSSHFGD